MAILIKITAKQLFNNFAIIVPTQDSLDANSFVLVLHGDSDGLLISLLIFLLFRRADPPQFGDIRHYSTPWSVQSSTERRGPSEGKKIKETI